MLKKRFKTMVALCLCLVMVLSIGISANAGYNHSFGFTVTAGTGGYDANYRTKSTDLSFAEVQYTKINMTNKSGNIVTMVRKGSSNATPGKTLYYSSLGTKYYNYSSGYGNVGDSYRLYGSVGSSVGGSVTLGGVWTP